MSTWLEYATDHPVRHCWTWSGGHSLIGYTVRDEPNKRTLIKSGSSAALDKPLLFNLKHIMNKKKTNTKSTRSQDLAKTYAILEKDSITNEVPKGFTGIFLFIDGDIKDLRIIGLN